MEGETGLGGLGHNDAIRTPCTFASALGIEKESGYQGGYETRSAKIVAL